MHYIEKENLDIIVTNTKVLGSFVLRKKFVLNHILKNYKQEIQQINDTTWTNYHTIVVIVLRPVYKRLTRR